MEDAARLLAGFEDRPVSDVLSALEYIDAVETGQTDQLGAVLRDRSAAEHLDAILTLLREGRDDQVRHLIEVLGGGRADLVCATALALATAGLHHQAAALLGRFAVHAAPPDVAALLMLLNADSAEAGVVVDAALTGRRDQGRVLDAFEHAGVGDPVRRRVGHLALALTAPDFVTLCVDLDAQDASQAIETLLTHCASRDDWESVRAGLHQANRHPLAYHLAEIRSELS